MVRVVASIEARMNSSRLPGKSLIDIEGVPTLTRVIRRLRLCAMVDDIVLATTTSALDDCLEKWAHSEQIKVFRGSEQDVLGRVVGAHEMMNSDIVVEITGDCPLLDPEVIDLGIKTFINNDCDVVANVRKPSYPQGVDVQVFKLSNLKHVAETINDPAVREHVSLYFYENPDRYKIFHLIAPSGWHAGERRFQLDYPEDLSFIRAVYKHLEPKHGDAFGVPEVLSLIKKYPKLGEINAHCEEKSVR